SDEPDKRDAPALSYVGSQRVFESVDGSFPNSTSSSSIGALTVTPMISERKFTDPENPRMWYDVDREKLSFNPEGGRMIGDEDILRSQHPGGTVVAFCDGHVEFIANDMEFGIDGTIWEPKQEQ
ncbi:MAG: H-X9-DG-CTERM domain-containing protein, partial [Thermoguttaceae bacterium]